MPEIKRNLYDKLKKRNISTLQLNRVLSEVGIDIPQRTLQYYLDSDMKKCNDDRIETVANYLIKNHDTIIYKLKLAL